MFRRRKAEPADTPDTDAPPAEEAQVPAGPDPVLTPPASAFDRSAGPWDESEAPEDDLARLDLGPLRIPALEGMELRLDVDQEAGQVVSVTVVAGQSSMQLTVFAAPRVEGIWDDVRREIAGSISSSGGTVDALSGTLGEELNATVPQDPSKRGSALVPVRFVGVDGPRWFLRGLLTGPAARDAGVAESLEVVFRGVVVVRGTDPMAPGDVLVLQVPSEVPAGMQRGDRSAGSAATSDDAEQDRQPLSPPSRGPEITEIR